MAIPVSSSLSLLSSLGLPHSWPGPQPGAPVLIALDNQGRGVVIDQVAHPCAAHVLHDVLASPGPRPHLALAATSPPRRHATDIPAGGDATSMATTARRQAVAQHGLSQREAEILDHICHGVSNQEIAETLYLSINTVKTYIKGCYRKLNLNGRPQAVRWGLTHGLGT